MLRLLNSTPWSRTRLIAAAAPLALAAATAARAQSADAAPKPTPAPNVDPDRSAVAENVPSSKPTQKPPPFKLFRYEEDYRALADPAKRTGFFDPVKYIRLGDSDTYLSIGGEARARYEYYSHPSFGLRTDSHDDFLLGRILLHGDFRTGPRDGLHFRGFAQLLSGWSWGEELPKPPTQENKLDLQQGFGDLVWGDEQNAPQDSLRLRVGRQEMGFGSFRLVTSRDPTNARLTFDGVRATAVLNGNTFDAFLTRPVAPEPDIFDDGEDDNTTFWGLYSVVPVLPEKRLSLDFYYLGLGRENTRFQSGVGDEVRHSIGTRVWGRSRGWDYDAEAVFQFGTFDTATRSQDIAAWTVATNTGYTFETATWSPRLGLKLNVASGDRNPNDGRLGTFNPLFPRNNYFSDATLLAPYNFFNAHPSVQLRPHDDVMLTLAWDAFFRYSTNDAVFSPGGIVIPAGASNDRFVGSTLTLQADWNISRNLSLTASYVHFFSGPVVRDAGGKDVDFLGSWLTFRF
ncbi:MAG: alginate export family protein [Phycisphaerales bacterium]|nr:alginate export family protein [Phycisphaerales bacterium]